MPVYDSAQETLLKEQVGVLKGSGADWLDSYGGGSWSNIWVMNLMFQVKHFVPVILEDEEDVVMARDDERGPF